MKNLTLAIVMIVALTGSANSQNYRVCSATEMIEQAKLNDPGYAVRLAQLEQSIQQHTQASAQQRTAGTVLYVIPVVVHIMHNYGPENISKAQVEDAIDIMNKSFQKLYADSVIVCSIFRPIIADVQVEFRLAQLDPNGNCTDGITRTVTPLTYNAGDNVKQLIDWPSHQYFNIWVVENIASGAAGYAYYPGINPAIDGVEIRHDYFGGIGTSIGSNYAERSLVHEAGHWLSLSHTWGNSNTPGLPANCGSSDYVLDTPLTIGTANFSCDTNQSTCGFIDNVQNYMDYASCHYMFTEGQKTRMHGALNDTTGGRSNLWTLANLMATGTNDGFVPGPCTPVADFLNVVRIICTGATVDFADMSWNGTPTNWQWNFPGGNPSSSNAQNPTIQYNTPGIYDVTLTASTSNGSSTITRNAIIQVSAAIGSSAVPYNEDFENVTIPSGTDWMIENPTGNGWTHITGVAYNGSKSMRLINHTGNPAGTTDVFLTPGYNFTNITNPGMTFRLAHAARSTSGSDNMAVYASNNCGDQWNFHWGKAGIALSTAGIISGNYVPTAPQWRLETLNMSTAIYSNMPSVRFKFEYEQDNANNIYVDDINITGVSNVGIQDVEFLATLNVFPNPAADEATIAFSLSSQSEVKVEVLDITGRQIALLADGVLNETGHIYSFGKGLPNGLYFVRITVDGNPITHKVVFTD